MLAAIMCERVCMTEHMRAGRWMHVAAQDAQFARHSRLIRVGLSSCMRTHTPRWLAYLLILARAAPRAVLRLCRSERQGHVPWHVIGLLPSGVCRRRAALNRTAVRWLPACALHTAAVHGQVYVTVRRSSAMHASLRHLHIHDRARSSIQQLVGPIGLT